MIATAVLTSLLGGALIGLAATLLLVSLGRIAGVSGILGSLLATRRTGEGWQLGFIVGLVAVGWLLLGRDNSAVPPVSTATVVVAGLLVGIGTRVGSGCTSGHGVCGLSRFSLRSLIATCLFMATAMVVVFVSRHVLAGGFQ